MSDKLDRKDRISYFYNEAESSGCKDIIINSGLGAFLENTHFICAGEKVDTGGFFEAPASTRFHGAYAGGLFDHSMAVYKRLKELEKNNGLFFQNPRSCFLIGILHDICKADSYVYNAEAGAWKYNLDQFEKDLHGAKSVHILERYLEITEEERLCVRFHMGAYETEAWADFDKAIRKYPTVLWTHTADMLASKVDDI